MPLNNKNNIHKFIINYSDISQTLYRTLPNNIFETNFVRPMSKLLPRDQRNNTDTKLDILLFVKEFLIPNLFYADSGNYKGFYLADNSLKSPILLKNNFDKFLYRIQEQTKGFNDLLEYEYELLAKCCKRIGNCFYIISVYHYIRLSFCQIKLYNTQT